MNLRYRLFILGLMILVFGGQLKAQIPYQHYTNGTIAIDIPEIKNPDLRYLTLYNIVNDTDLSYTISEDEESVLLSSDELNRKELKKHVETLIRATETEFSQYLKSGKEEQGLLFSKWKSSLPQDLFVMLFRIMTIENPPLRDGNQHCVDSDPFCTTDVVTFHVDANPGGVCEPGPNYGCMSPYTQRPPFWFHMKIGVAGTFTIRITNSNNLDLDFCCWGPFNHPTTPCTAQLTSDKIVDCDSPSNTVQECTMPASSQVGEYYIMVITKYTQNQATDITFQKVANSGPGETDCGILPPLVSSDSPLCVGETLHLTANGQAGASYSWTGPSGWTSNQQNPTRTNCTMAMAGNYTCTISLNGHTNNATTSVVILPKPTANFTAPPVCKGTPTHFTSTSSTNPPNQTITSYQWNFGDGATGTGASVNHTYGSAGNYQAKLTVSTGGSCTNEKTQTVTVYDMPRANAGPDQSIVYGATATLSGSGGAGSFTYHWEPANKVVNPNAQTTQTVSLTETTQFTLTVTSISGGCSDTDQVTVSINGTGMTATANADDNSLCEGESTTLHAYPTGGSGNYTYSWTPTTGLNDPSSQHPVATPPVGNTTYTCHVNDNGLSSQDVSVSIQVHPNESTDVYDSFCENETFSFFGENLDEPGTYTHILETQYGCDSTIILHLSENPTYTTPITDVFCEGDSYEWFGQTYSQSGTYEHTLQTIHGCDSVIRLTLTKLSVSHNNITASICPGGSYPFFGEILTEPGTYSGTATNQWGCDSIVELTLTINDYYETAFSVDLCDGSYVWEGTDLDPLTENGDYEYTFQSQAGCDSIVTLHLTFHPVQDGNYTMTACDSYTWEQPLGNGQTYTQSGTYSVPKTTQWGCDYENHLELTINNSKQTDLSLTECDYYVWDGNNAYNTFTDTIMFSGNYSNTFKTKDGCDSLVNIAMDMEYYPGYTELYGNRWPIGGSLTHISIEEYQIKGYNHLANFETTWELDCPDWTFETYGENNVCCKIVITTFPSDSILLKATTTNRCGTFCDSIWIHCTYFDVDEYEDLCDVNIVPNPNSGDMTINFSNMLGEVNIRVYDMTGNLVETIKTYNDLNNIKMSYSMPQRSTGMYYFVISNKDKMITKKVIVM